MKRCPICYKELSPYDKKYCGPTCTKIGHDTRNRVYHQTLKYQAIMGGGKQRHLKFEEKILKKICEDCGEEFDRIKTTRCAKCAKKRQNEQSKEHMKNRKKPERKPCKHCGGKIGDDQVAQARFCSDKCREDHNKKPEEVKVDKRAKSKIDPKWLTRGDITKNLYSSSMGSI